MHKYLRTKREHGFTLMEIVVATTIFASVVTLMLTLFNQTLRIYRRTEAIRQTAQSVRNTMEYVVKEVRNGKIDYSVQDGQILLEPVDPCPAPAVPDEDIYVTDDQSFVGIQNVDGQRECIYWDQVDSIFIQIEGLGAPSRLNPTNVKFTNVKFIVRPSHDPFASPPGIMPSVTILAVAETTLPTGENYVVPYQTTVSTYQYDLPYAP